MARFAEGQYVELCPTIPSILGDSVSGGTRGIVRSVDLTRPNDAIYLIGFPLNEKLTGEVAWLREIDLSLRSQSPAWRSERNRGVWLARTSSWRLLAATAELPVRADVVWVANEDCERQKT